MCKANALPSISQASSFCNFFSFLGRGKVWGFGPHLPVFKNYSLLWSGVIFGDSQGGPYMWCQGFRVGLATCMSSALSPVLSVPVFVILGGRRATPGCAWGLLTVQWPGLTPGDSRGVDHAVWVIEPRPSARNTCILPFGAIFPAFFFNYLALVAHKKF